MMFRFIALVITSGTGVAAISVGNSLPDSEGARADAVSEPIGGEALPPLDAGGQERKRLFRREDVPPGSATEASGSATVALQSGDALEVQSHTHHWTRASTVRRSVPAVPAVLAAEGVPSEKGTSILNKLEGKGFNDAEGHAQAYRTNETQICFTLKVEKAKFSMANGDGRDLGAKETTRECVETARSDPLCGSLVRIGRPGTSFGDRTCVCNIKERPSPSLLAADRYNIYELCPAATPGFGMSLASSCQREAGPCPCKFTDSGSCVADKCMCKSGYCAEGGKCVLGLFEQQGCMAAVDKQEIAGASIVKEIQISGESDADLDTACCASCSGDVNCRFWSRERGPTGSKKCVLFEGGDDITLYFNADMRSGRWSSIAASKDQVQVIVNCSSQARRSCDSCMNCMPCLSGGIKQYNGADCDSDCNKCSGCLAFASCYTPPDCSQSSLKEDCWGCIGCFGCLEGETAKPNGDPCDANCAELCGKCRSVTSCFDVDCDSATATACRSECLECAPCKNGTKSGSECDACRDKKCNSGCDPLKPCWQLPMPATTETPSLQVPKGFRPLNYDAAASSQTPQAMGSKERGLPGHANCPCVGMSINGYLVSNIEDPDSPGDFVQYQLPVGAGCKDWDNLYHPDCRPGKSPGPGNGWCAQKWCFVDPCNCNLNASYRRSHLFKTPQFPNGATYQGKPLAYSYITCDSPDLLEPPGEQGAADYKVGSGKDGARTKVDEIDCDSEVVNAASLGMHDCMCIGLQNVSGILSPSISDPTSGLSTTVEYSASVGSSCAVWDMSTNPICAGKDHDPPWCGTKENEKWCFVDPCKCGIPIKPEPAVMAPSAGIGNQPVFYSRATCQPNNRDMWADPTLHTSCLQFLDKAACEQSPVGVCNWLKTGLEAGSDEGVCVEPQRKHCPREALHQMVPKSGLPSSEQADCPEELCPDGKGLKIDAEKGEVKCASTPCALTDIDTCCAAAATCDTFGDCGAKGVLRENAKDLLCRRSDCNFDLDYNTCCADRALCTDFPSDKCPVGYRRLKDFESMTCEKTECNPESDFVRCCESDKVVVVWGLFFMAIIAGCCGACVTVGLIQNARAAKNKAEEIKKLSTQTREDPVDREVLTYLQFKAKYKGKLEDAQLDERWAACPPILNNTDAANILQAKARSVHVQNEYAPFKIPRTNGAQTITFAQHREINAAMNIDECRDEYLKLPAAEGYEEQLEKANELRTKALEANAAAKKAEEADENWNLDKLKLRANARAALVQARRRSLQALPPTSPQRKSMTALALKSKESGEPAETK